MEALSPRSVVSRAPGVVGATVDQEEVLMSVDSGAYFGLDPVASAVWRGIAAPVQVAALCAGLREDFEVSQERCEADVLQLLERFRAARLITVADAGAA